MALTIPNWPVVTNDDGSLLTGTPFDLSYNEAVEAAVLAVVRDSASGEYADTIAAEVVAARGNEVDLDTRLSGVIDDDGVWINPGTIESVENIDISVTAGENIALRDIVYLSDGSGSLTAGRWYIADATNDYSSSAAPAIGVANASASAGASVSVRRIGQIASGLGVLVAGTRYYVGTAGALTSTAPTNARVVGTAESTSALRLHADAPLTEGTQSIDGDKTFNDDVAVTGTLTAAGGFAAPPMGVPTYSRCDTTLVKNANITLENVSGLAFAVGANEVWAFQFYLFGISNSTADFRFTLTGPAAPTSVRFGYLSTMDTPGVGSDNAFGDLLAAGGTTVDQAMMITGLLRNGANAGTVQLQFAQNVSNASDSKIYEDSYVLAWRLS